MGIGTTYEETSVRVDDFPKAFGIYTPAPILLSAGTLMYTYQILPGCWRPIRGGLSAQVWALDLKSDAGEILRLR